MANGGLVQQVSTERLAYSRGRGGYCIVLECSGVNGQQTEHPNKRSKRGEGVPEEGGIVNRAIKTGHGDGP